MHSVVIDQGTTSSRCIIFQSAGIILGRAQHPIRQLYPQPGWVEHDPEDLWESSVASIADALAAAGLDGSRTAAIGITNQRETILLWDRSTGRALHPAIVWQDRRTAADCDRHRADGAEPWITARTGLRLDPYFSATKLAWLLDHIPGARSAADAGRLAAGTVDSWLLWRLTGGRVHATDRTNASRTLLCSLHQPAWDPDLLAHFRIPASILPEIRSSSEIYGTVASGPLAGRPIAALVGDQQAALFGQGCRSAGEAKNTYGTGCFLLLHTGRQAVAPPPGLLSTIAADPGPAPAYALEGSIFAAGAVIQWLRDELHLVRDVAEFDALAAAHADSGGVVLVPAFTGLGTPHWDPHARGLLIGLTRGTSRGHICRAAIDAITHQVADVLDLMQGSSGKPLLALRVDGGAARSDPLLQAQADLLGTPVVRPADLEATALGAACLAAISTGIPEPAPGAAGDDAPTGRTFLPSGDAPGRGASRARWARAVDRSRGWAAGG